MLKAINCDQLVGEETSNNNDAINHQNHTNLPTQDQRKSQSAHNDMPPLDESLDNKPNGTSYAARSTSQASSQRSTGANRNSTTIQVQHKFKVSNREIDITLFNSK